MYQTIRVLFKPVLNPFQSGRLSFVGLLTVLALSLIACGGAADSPPPVVLVTQGADSFPQVVEPTAIVPPTSTPLPPTATPTPGPTATPQPTATAIGGVVATPAVELALDPEAEPPSLGTIEQPPYAESECSDKYPCNEDEQGWEERIQLPEGFTVDYYGRVDGQPNVITFGPDGLLYIGTMTGEIFTMDDDGQVELYVDGFLAPAGLAFQPGTERLYVASRVIDQNVDGEAELAVVVDGVVEQLIGELPCCYVAMHSANGIAFGPDGYGYLSVGARADHGEILSGPDAGQQDELQPFEASILRFSPDGTEVDVYARGFRNAYDIAWDADGQLWNTDNMPDFGPPEEFNRVEPGGEHGYPWYDCEVCFPAPADVAIVEPMHLLTAHSSPTGIIAYLADQFPGYYNSLFVTLWSAFPEAQRILWFSPGGEETATFATGFAAPIDLTIGPDGSLFVADWATGIIFRISYIGEAQ